MGERDVTTPAYRVDESLETVRRRIARAGGDPDRVRIVAVTKGHGPEAVSAALRAGLIDVGENYAAELVAKAGALAPAERDRVRWHFIGGIQRNKVRPLAALVDTWQSVDRPAEVDSIAQAAPGARIFVQVLLSPGTDRGGVDLAEVDRLVGAAADRLTVRGLMAVGPPGPPEAARAGFRQVAAAAARLGLPEVSIGMSHDLEVAVQEGATMVRLGTALFGPRMPARRPPTADGPL